MRWQTDETNSSSSNDVISFFDADITRVLTPHNDVVIISMTIANYNVKKILIDNKNSIDVLFYNAFLKDETSQRMTKVDQHTAGQFLRQCRTDGR